jgi:capsular polysaccharide biosynthesis protein
MELMNYLGVLKKRLWLIVVFVVIATATTGYYTNRYYHPIYQASTKLIVNKTIENGGVEQMDFTAVASNIRLIDTYKEIIKSSAIMSKVVEQYPELNLTSTELVQRVNVNSVNQTQIMLVSFVDTSYERAAKVVNAVSKVFQTEIRNIMKIDNVALLNEASLTDSPGVINNPVNQNILFSFILSLLFAIGIAFLLEYMDDTLKNEEDIRSVLDIPVLATVAMVHKKDMQTKKRRKGSKQIGEGAYAAANQ